MARIRKEDHPRILHMIDVEHLKVPDVAASFGCTPANIYALLSRLRRQTEPSASAVQPPLALEETAMVAAAPVAEAVPAAPEPTSAEPTSAGPTSAEPTSAEPASSELTACELTTCEPVAAEPLGAAPVDKADSTEPAANVVRFEATAPAAAPPKPQAVSAVPARRGAPGGVGAKLAKPGYGLMMRTADGEENLTPFRSLDELLSAIKPILRAAASSPEPVWFSLQPIDLASIDMDAA